MSAKRAKSASKAGKVQRGRGEVVADGAETADAERSGKELMSAIV
jgi:hypothetical protein